MRQFVVIVLCLAVCLSQSVAGSGSRTEQRTYEAAATGDIVSTEGNYLTGSNGFLFNNWADPLNATADGSFDVGGVFFETRVTDTTMAIHIEDAYKAKYDPANKSRVPAIVCQAVKDERQCDVSERFCGSITITFGDDPLGFVAGRNTTVGVFSREFFVVNTSEYGVGLYAAYNIVGACGGENDSPAYSGTITAIFS